MEGFIVASLFTKSAANDSANGSVCLDKLEKEILSSSISASLGHISQRADEVYIQFDSDLTTQEETDLNTLFSAHAGNIYAPYERIVEDAIYFFNGLMIHYAAENITKGITFYDKTKEVADFLKDVMRYGQSGSLYEVAKEIKDLRVLGWPTGLESFVNDSDMQSMLNQVETYLGVSPLTDWS